MIWRKSAVIAALFLTSVNPIHSASALQNEHIATGILKGELRFPEGRAGTHPFLLAYSAASGELVIPLQEHDWTAGFEIVLRPGIYYLFAALEGYEPISHVVEILEGQVVVYSPQLEPSGLILEYTRAPSRINWQLPLRRPPGFEIFPLPPK